MFFFNYNDKITISCLFIATSLFFSLSSFCFSKRPVSISANCSFPGTPTVINMISSHYVSFAYVSVDPYKYVLDNWILRSTRMPTAIFELGKSYSPSSKNCFFLLPTITVLLVVFFGFRGLLQ